MISAVDKDLTYRDLLKYLQSLSDSQLDKFIQIIPNDPDGDALLPLQPAVCVGMVIELEYCPPTIKNKNGTTEHRFRSYYDGKWHGDDIVIYTDYR